MASRPIRRAAEDSPRRPATGHRYEFGRSAVRVDSRYDIDMNIGWQEIVAVGVVGLAAVILIRRALGTGSRSCGGCGPSHTEEHKTPAHGIKITEVHQVKIERQLPESQGEETRSV